MAAADARRYEHIFQQMDGDRDNYVLVSSAESMSCQLMHAPQCFTTVRHPVDGRGSLVMKAVDLPVDLRFRELSVGYAFQVMSFPILTFPAGRWDHCS